RRPPPRGDRAHAGRRRDHRRGAGGRGTPAEGGELDLLPLPALRGERVGVRGFPRLRNRCCLELSALPLTRSRRFATPPTSPRAERGEVRIRAAFSPDELR